jgi:hypothetical protein
MKKVIVFTILLLSSIGSKAQTILMQETFTNNSLPPGWTIDSAGITPVNGWKFTGQPSGVTGVGFDSHYPRLRDIGVNQYFDCNLTSSLIDASAVNGVYLSYSNQCNAGQISYSYCYPIIEVTNDSGVTWNEVFRSTISNYPVKRNIVNLTGLAVGSSNVKIRFRFKEYQLGGWWAIDSVVVADSMPCISPPDSGTTSCVTKFACTGSPAQLFIDNLSRGIGQTYQWQLNNAASGNVYVNVPGAVYDTLTETQNGNTYYQCIITCGGLSTNSMPLMVQDTPVAVDAYSDNIHICTGRDDTLRLYQPNGGSGVGWQWQSSSLPYSNYIDIPGATNDTYLMSPSNFSNSTYFRSKQVCLSNGTERAGFWVNEVPNPNPMCYCYPWSNNICSNNYYLSNFQIQTTTLNNNTICIDTLIVHTNNNSYQFFDPALGNTTALLTRGTTFTVSLTSVNQGQWVGLWIDYNRDGNFDPNEFTNLSYVPAGTPTLAQFYVPATATPGLTGLRLRSWLWTALDSTWTCSSITGGQTEDYIVTIDTATGISIPLANEEGVTVFPNPAKDEITLSSQKFGDNVNLKVTDLTGREILSQKKLTVNCKLKTVNLTAGIYFVKVATDNGSVVRKFVKE